MLNDTEDDFFYEEDKMSSATSNYGVAKPFLQYEEDMVTMHAPSVEENAVVKLSAEIHEIEVKDTLGTGDIDVSTVVYGTLNDDANNLGGLERQKFELERLGMVVTTKCAVITKDDSNLIGISIGGGAPFCPCLYIVQVFDGTPAALEGSLESGDELLAVNSVAVKGKTKVEVAKMIQAATKEVKIHYNKLHADPEQGKSLDIILKKFKHRLVESISSSTADTLGLSRAILCNDSLVKRLEELEGTEIMYKGLVDHARRMLKAYFDLLRTYKCFGDCFTQISAREPQQRASEVFRTFGEFHRNLEKDGLEIIKNIKPILADLGTYLNKAIPDTKLTVRRYADAKFTYLSYCLKIKEMDDEEHSFAGLQEPLYRVETGNYEYRLILRCRQDARSKFAKLRTDVLEKMELLECKHATDLNNQLRRLLKSLAQLHYAVVARMDALPPLFPIEVDFKETDFQYKSSTLKPQELDDDEEENSFKATNGTSTISSAPNTNETTCGIEAIEEPAAIINVARHDHESTNENNVDLLSGLDSNPTTSMSSTNTTEITSNSRNQNDNEALLKDLGLFGMNLVSNSQTVSNEKDSIKAQNDSYDFDLFLNQVAAKPTQLECDLMQSNGVETDLLLQ